MHIVVLLRVLLNGIMHISISSCGQWVHQDSLRMFYDCFFVQELRFEDCEASSLKYSFVCAKSCFLEVKTVSRVSAYVRVLHSNWKRKKHKFLVFPEVPVPVLFMQHLPVLRYFLSKKRNIKSHLVIPTYLNLKVSFNNYWLLTTFW